MPQDHTLLHQLRESPVDRSPADTVSGAQLVLGRKALPGSVATAQDLLQQQRLELEVDRDRLLRIDCHSAT
jgi:hypothetical protein